jgi:hypothetical protein
MVESTSSTVVKDYKSFRTVSVASSASLLLNNMSSNNGTSFVVVKNTEQGGQLSLFGNEITESKADTVQPATKIVENGSDCIGAKFIQVQGQSLLVGLFMSVCRIYNHNMTRKLFEFSPTEGKTGADPASVWFTSCTLASYSDSGEQFIAVSTNEGRIFAVEVQSGGVSFNKDIGFTLGISDAILDLTYDPKTKYLGLATGTGHIAFLAAYQD